MRTIFSYRPADSDFFPTFIPYCQNLPLIYLYLLSPNNPTKQSPLPPILPAGTIHTPFRLSHYLAHMPPITQQISKIRWYYGDPYLLTNPLAAILALDLLLDHRITRRPSIRPRDDEQRQRDDKQPDDLADEFPIHPHQRSSVHLLSPKPPRPVQKSTTSPINPLPSKSRHKEEEFTYP